MIIDCHAHVFQNWHGACGHSSIDVHLKYIQKNVTRPAAETFRVRDGKRVKPGLLFREGDNPSIDNTWAGLKDVDFRVGRNGRRHRCAHRLDQTCHHHDHPNVRPEFAGPPPALAVCMNGLNA